MSPAQRASLGLPRLSAQQHRLRKSLFLLEPASLCEAELMLPEHCPPTATSPLPTTVTCNTSAGSHGSAETCTGAQQRHPRGDPSCWDWLYLSQLMGAIHGFPIIVWTPAAKRDTVK